MGANAGAVKLIRRAGLVFWDFDGVIKDSVEVKASAFEALFLPFGGETAQRVRRHHEANSGMSRYEKVPIYLEWAGERTDAINVEEYCERFSQRVLQAVIDAPWVPGVREYLLANHGRQRFVLVTATPEGEIRKILDAIDIDKCFCEVHGAPTSKVAAMAWALERLNCDPATALMVGDAEADMVAARENSISFLLRRTPLNTTLQARYSGPMFEDLGHG